MREGKENVIGGCGGGGVDDLRNVNDKRLKKQEGLFSFSCKGGDNRRGFQGWRWLGRKSPRRGRLGHGETFSTIVRIHRVIHYICNRVIVSGHFMRRREAGELHRSDIRMLLPQLMESRFSRAI